MVEAKLSFLSPNFCLMWLTNASRLLGNLYDECSHSKDEATLSTERNLQRTVTRTFASSRQPKLTTPIWTLEDSEPFTQANT